MYKSLASNTVFLLAANILYAINQWLQLSVVARSFSAELLGEYTLSIAIVTPLIALFSFQLRTIQITDVEDKWVIDDFITFRIISSFLLLTIALVLSYLYMGYSMLVIFSLVLTLKIADGFSEIFNNAQQKEENMKVIFYSFFLKSFISSTSFIFSALFFKELWISLSLSILSVFFVLIFFDYKKVNYSFLKHRACIKKMKKLFLLGLPLAIVIFIVAINSNISKYMIDFLLDRDTQGIYSVLSYFFVAGGILMAALGQSFSPRLSQAYFSDKNKNNFIIYSFWLLLCALLIGLSAVFISFYFGGIVLKVMFGSNISKHSELFYKIMIAGIPLYLASAAGYILSSMREFKIQPLVNGCLVCFSIPLTYFYIKNDGILGVTVSLFLIYCLQFIFTSFAIYYCIFIRKKTL